MYTKKEKEYGWGRFIQNWRSTLKSMYWRKGRDYGDLRNNGIDIGFIQMPFRYSNDAFFEYFTFVMHCSDALLKSKEFNCSW